MSGIPTAGAIPVRNEKGEISMQKVKVQRYITGRRPDYVNNDSSDESESDGADFAPATTHTGKMAIEVPQLVISSEPLPQISQEDLMSDPRMRRLQKRLAPDSDDEENKGPGRGRRVDDPEIVKTAQEDPRRRRPHREVEESESDEDVEEDIERRHALLKARKAQLERDEEMSPQDEVADEADESDGDEESEYEEYTGSEEEETAPRLKPVFVRKNDRITIKEKERLEAERTAAEEDATRRLEKARREETLRMVEEDHRQEEEEAREAKEEEQLMLSLAACLTDDESEETAYEAWKLRELKRIKRDKEEREALAREKDEAEMIHKMSEKERHAYFRANPKEITNLSEKGTKYRFLQRYYHRGAFFLDEDEQILKRDVAEPTLEDHFDKSTLPKVMQVKNFGRSGNTKYTHLKDQDTTGADSPWLLKTGQTSKFYSTQAGGMKQSFDRPSGSRNRKTTD